MKESGKQREFMIFKDYISTVLGPSITARIAKELCGYCHKCISLVKSIRFVFFN